MTLCRTWNIIDVDGEYSFIKLQDDDYPRGNVRMSSTYKRN